MYKKTNLKLLKFKKQKLKLINEKKPKIKQRTFKW